MTQTSTAAGTVMGTVGYMSPEQVRGATVGPSSDMFSLGCVLYEMIAGRQAFRGPSSAETLSAILRDTPGRLRRDWRASAAGVGAVDLTLSRKESGGTLPVGAGPCF